MSGVEEFSELRERLAREAGPGEHVWVVMATIVLGVQGADRFSSYTPAGRIEALSPNSRLGPHPPPVDVSPVACLLCELEEPAAAGERCRGIPTSYAPDGAPRWA